MVRRIFAFFGTKIGFALLVAACIVAGAIVSVNLPEEKERDESVVAVDLIKKSLEVDRDGDGLKDWEESLYGTDAANPDTDADGMGDNDEVKANRSPLVAGSGEGAKVEAAATSSARVTTATDRFSQELFTKYLEAKSSGAEIDEELSNAIAEELVNQEYDSAVQPYDVSRLDISPDESVQSLRAYGNALGKVLSTPPADPNEFEYTVLERALTGAPSAGDANLMTRIIARYDGMLKSLIGMKVPAGIASVHAEFIQGIEMSRNGAVGVATLDTDPIGAYSKIGQYENTLNVLTAATLKARSFFQSKGVVFSAQESGYVLAR